ncbi:uncharacterized protein GLRG_11069 [Colletotrichum graminicola M1.001]|uniref:Uncharacterized protein n=1 Tax=Colletotrichum graminicola (strain M1.001 / M2 / FGSC 10212) TaxID=645133 RepID=E3QYE0_COLGM|nr:uncharacterized protein GLRG_11069 [Colletotrichum graminicola M1.001]EFQ35878.1 hypothetical protein GLRG_11069 [Colletotrichum graminicola M1.001]
MRLEHGRKKAEMTASKSTSKSTPKSAEKITEADCAAAGEAATAWALFVKRQADKEVDNRPNRMANEDAHDDNTIEPAIEIEASTEEGGDFELETELTTSLEISAEIFKNLARDQSVDGDHQNTFLDKEASGNLFPFTRPHGNGIFTNPDGDEDRSKLHMLSSTASVVTPSGNAHQKRKRASLIADDPQGRKKTDVVSSPPVRSRNKNSISRLSDTADKFADPHGNASQQLSSVTQSQEGSVRNGGVAEHSMGSQGSSRITELLSRSQEYPPGTSEHNDSQKQSRGFAQHPMSIQALSSTTGRQGNVEGHSAVAGTSAIERRITIINWIEALLQVRHLTTGGGPNSVDAKHRSVSMGMIKGLIEEYELI